MKPRRIRKFGLEMDQNVWIIFAIVVVIALIMGVLLIIDTTTN